MGPMVARLAIGQLLSNRITAAELVSLLQIENEEENIDYNMNEVDIVKLLKDMEIKFDPKRSSLKNYRQ